MWKTFGGGAGGGGENNGKLEELIQNRDWNGGFAPKACVCFLETDKLSQSFSFGKIFGGGGPVGGKNKQNVDEKEEDKQKLWSRCASSTVPKLKTWACIVVQTFLFFHLERNFHSYEDVTSVFGAVFHFELFMSTENENPRFALLKLLSKQTFHIRNRQSLWLWFWKIFGGAEID